MDRRKKTVLSAVCVGALSAAFLITSLTYAFAGSRRTTRRPSETGRTAVSSAAPSTTAASSAPRTTQSTQAPDISSLSGKKIGWGLGAHYDEQARPTDALTAQERYGALGGRFIDPSGKKIIYLTFDEGYENGYSAAILDALQQKNVRATFFITGDYAKREEELVRRMIGEGHTVGNHTWKHYSMPEKSLDVCRGELKELEDYVREQYGYQMTVMRPPKGEFSEQTLALASEMGYTTWLWSFAYQDWNVNAPGDPAASLQKLCARLHPGAVYLLHAVSPTNARILPDFIDAAREQGYEFVTP